MIQLQKKDYFDVTGGIQAESSLVNFNDNEFFTLENITRSRESTLKTRKGRQCYASVTSATPIKGFDRYSTDTKQELIMSNNGKLYYSNNSTGISTTLNFQDTITSIDSYDSVNFTADLSVGASHCFLAGDEVSVTISGTDYTWSVLSVASGHLYVQGIVGPPTLTGPTTCYGSRVSDTILVSNAINFKVNDMVIYGDIDRHFKVLAVDSSSTPNTLQLDEEIYSIASSTPTTISVSERWEQFTYCDKSLSDTITCSTAISVANNTITSTTALTNGWGVYLVPIGAGVLPSPFVSGIKYFVINATSGPNTCKLSDTEGGTAVDITTTGTGTFTLLSGYDAPMNTLFDASATQPYASSSMLRENLIITDGENEPLVYDGTEICRMGFHELPDLYNELTLVDSGTGTVTAGQHSYLITYTRYDNNGELIESGITDMTARKITVTSGYNVAIPVPVIPYKFNNELLYNVNKCSVTVYKNEVDGTNFYRALEVDMKTLGNFHIKSIEDSGANMIVELYGSPDISKLNAGVSGDYVLIKGNKNSANNGVFRMTAKDNTTKKITLSNASAVTQAAVGGTSTIGYAVICIRDNIADTTLVNNDLLYNNKNIEAENQPPVLAKYVSMWDNRCWMMNGKTYQEVLVDIGTVVSNIASGDSLTITCGATTEVYEFRSSGDTTIANAIRVDISAGYVTIITDLLEMICESINSKPDGLCWAYYERVTGAGSLVLRERQRQINPLKIKFNLATAANLVYFRINNIYLTAANNNVDSYFIQNTYSSRVWFSKTAQGQSFVGTFGNISAETVFWNDIYPDNGQLCTGMMPQPQMLLLFKENSSFKATSLGGDAYNIEIVDNNIGCIAPKTIVSLGNDVLFLSKIGVHSTDGFTVKFIGKKLRREWKKMNSSYYELSCGANVTKNGQYWVTVPYNSDLADATENNTTFVYDYERDAWYKWTNTPIVTYVKINESGLGTTFGDTQYMASTTGQVYTMRELDEPSDYRDDSTAIESTIITKWYDFDDKTARKMFYKLILNLYQTDAPNSLDLYYAYDFGENFEKLSSISSVSGQWGYCSYGTAPMGGVTTLNTIKQPLSPEKCFYVRFKLYNGEIDKIIELQGLSIEAKMLNTKAIAQAENE